MKPYLIISIFILVACKKEGEYNVPCNSPTNNLEVSKSLIIGKWVWVSELYRQPFTSQYILKTPQTEGYTRQLSVTRNTLKFFKNNSLDEAFLYELVRESTLTNYPEDSTNVLVFKNSNTGVRISYTHYKICNDTLILDFQILSQVKGKEKWFKVE